MFPKLSTTHTVTGSLTEPMTENAVDAGGQDWTVVVDVVVTELETEFEPAVCASTAEGANAASSRRVEITARRVFCICYNATSFEPSV